MSSPWAYNTNRNNLNCSGRITNYSNGASNWPSLTMGWKKKLWGVRKNERAWILRMGLISNPSKSTTHAKAKQSKAKCTQLWLHLSIQSLKSNIIYRGTLTAATTVSVRTIRTNLRMTIFAFDLFVLISGTFTSTETETSVSCEICFLAAERITAFPLLEVKKQLKQVKITQHVRYDSSDQYILTMIRIKLHNIILNDFLYPQLIDSAQN